MIKVHQTIIDKGHGNCMQAAIATLFSKQLDEIPNFIEHDGWFQPLYNFIRENGYEYHGMIYNKNYTALWHPTHGCFEKEKWHRHSIMTPKRLYKEEGVNGLFYAGVLSPKYFNFFSGSSSTHAVLIDKDYNIMFDPNPEYEKLFQYPLARILKYGGIIDVVIINPK
jgi:hypothetical protein